MMYNSGRDLVLRTTIACGVIETFAVALRMIARWRSNASFAIDDWVLVASLIPSYGMLANGMIMVTLGGAGRHAAELSPSELEVFMKTTSTGLVTYSLTITMVKISILLLYRRVFDTRKIKHVTAVLGGVCVAWGVIAIVCLIFQCRPISGMWDPSATYTNKCFDIKAYYSSVSGTNMALDILVLSIPLYMVWGLNLRTSQKIGLTCIFLLGGLVCVASLMRIITVNFIKGTDLPHSVVTPYVWSQIEPTTAIICACLTTYRPLFKGLSLQSFSSLSWIGSLRSRSGTADNGTVSSASARGSRLPESTERWSKFDFTTDLKPLPTTTSSIPELRHFQESSSKATNGGLRVFDSRGSIDLESQRHPASEKGSWLDSPNSMSEIGSRAPSIRGQPHESDWE